MHGCNRSIGPAAFHKKLFCKTSKGSRLFQGKFSLMLHLIPETLSTFHRSSSPEVFLGKGVLKICSKFTGEHPCRSVISIKLLLISVKCSPKNLLYIFRTPFYKNTYGGLLLKFHGNI